MEIFNVKQKEIDQVIKKEEMKSTNPLKINKRKRKQKDIIIKLIEHLPDHHKDKKEYLLCLKDSIDIPIVYIRCKKCGHHVTECRKKEKDEERKEKTSVSLQDLMTKAKTIKQEIKEDNSTNITEHSEPMIDPPSLEEDSLDNDNNQQNILSLINRVIFQKWHT